MSAPAQNADPAEIAKFSALAQSWWDPNGPSKMLHELNPLRLRYLQCAVTLPGKQVLDVGCGGGILSESMARAGARVLGIDLSPALLEVAELHALQAGVARRLSVGGRGGSRARAPGCLRCGHLHGDARARAGSGRGPAGSRRPGKAGGDVIVSTLNRHPLAFAVAILGAEYIAQVLPRGTHEYLKFIRPSELARWGGPPASSSSTCAASPTTR